MLRYAILYYPMLRFAVFALCSSRAGLDRDGSTGAFEWEEIVEAQGDSPHRTAVDSVQRACARAEMCTAAGWNICADYIYLYARCVLSGGADAMRCLSFSQFGELLCRLAAEAYPLGSEKAAEQEGPAEWLAYALSTLLESTMFPRCGIAAAPGVTASSADEFRARLAVPAIRALLCAPPSLPPSLSLCLLPSVPPPHCTALRHRTLNSPRKEIGDTIWRACCA